MANYPYISGFGAISSAFAQLRRTVPARIDSGFLQRNNIAPANESYVISIMRFLGLIDEDGNRVENKTDFLYGDDQAFRSGLEAALRDAYQPLFDDLGDEAFSSSRDVLTHWFRTADKTSGLVGQRQAGTFLTLAALAGHGEAPTVRAVAKKGSSTTKKAAGQAATKVASSTTSRQGTTGNTPTSAAQATASGAVGTPPGVGLSVRVEVNLPAGESAETYDAIFASIKKHLMS